MRRYTHILFDHDGVLVDTEPLYYQATRESMAELGIELQVSEHLELMREGKHAWELARQEGVAESEIDRVRSHRTQRYRELLGTEPIDIDGVECVLARLAENYQLAIVTTALPDDFALIHQDRTIVQYFDFVLTRSAYKLAKPHPDPYLAALARFEIGPETALAVEDSQRGLNAAVAAGLDCAVVYNDFTANQDFSVATYRVDRLADLASCVLDQH